jgi:hypothetical protein
VAKTTINDVQDQVQEFWSDLFMGELKETTLLPSLVNKDYEGDIQQGGDTVYVSQINRPAGERKTIGSVGSETFTPETLDTQRIAIVADQRITASFEFNDVVMLQSQIGRKDSEIRQALLEAVEIQLNDYLYSLTAPSAAAPDHVVTGITDFNASVLNNNVRKLAAKANWMKQKGWYLLADPSYYSNMLDDTKIVSSDFGAADAPVIGGQIGLNRYGFNIFEDTSAGLVSLSGTDEQAALAFHPDYLHLVMQRQPTFKVSDLHSNKEFGFVISVDMIVGAALGNDGDVKHISVINA